MFARLARAKKENAPALCGLRCLRVLDGQVDGLRFPTGPFAVILV
jgi:hypothetical protein